MMATGLSPAHQALVMVEWRGYDAYGDVESCAECGQEASSKKHDTACALDAELTGAGLDTQAKREAARDSIRAFRESQATARRAKEIDDAEAKRKAEAPGPKPSGGFRDVPPDAGELRRTISTDGAVCVLRRPIPRDVHRCGVSIRSGSSDWVRLHRSFETSKQAAAQLELLVLAGVPRALVQVSEWYEPILGDGPVETPERRDAIGSTPAAESLASHIEAEVIRWCADRQPGVADLRLEHKAIFVAMASLSRESTKLVYDKLSLLTGTDGSDAALSKWAAEKAKVYESAGIKNPSSPAVVSRAEFEKLDAEVRSLHLRIKAASNELAG